MKNKLEKIVENFKIKIKTFLKNFIEYTIENDVRIYRLKHTPLKVKKSLIKRAERTCGKYQIQRNKVVFDNYMGKSYGGNCKYVTEELLKRNSELEIVWMVENVAAHIGEFPKQVRLVEYKSEQAMLEYYTAAVWICNYHLIAYFNKGLQKRKGQYYIQMWHGALGIKKIENDCECLTESSSWYYLAEKNSRNTDYWISNSAFETDVYRRAFWNVNQVLEYGHPRNDLFFGCDLSEVEQKVKQALQIEAEENIVLYVPTFRENGGFPENKIAVGQIVQALGDRFGGSWRMVVRLHPRMQGTAEHVCDMKNADHVVTKNYPDIQELLAASQVVITDYSSCIFDFLFTDRPGFIYAPDVEAYNNERGFYYPLEETPFPIAEDNEQLIQNVRAFDENSYRRNVKEFIAGKGCVEDGQAAVRVAELVENIVQKVGTE